MKRFFRIFAAVALVCSTLVACEEKFDDYTPAAPETTAQVYFSKDATTTFDLLKTEQVEVSVMRAVTAGALDVAITATVDEAHQGLFNIPSSVSFADGEAATTLVITFDPADLEYGEQYPVTLQIAADKITDYGKDLINLVLDYPEPFVSLGKGTFSDAWNFEDTYSVEIRQNSLNPSVFRIIDPYSQGIKAEGLPSKGGPAEYIEFRLLKKGDTINDVEITRDDLIYFNRFNTGYYSSANGEETAIHPGEFKGMTEDNFVYSRVVEWQENGLPGIVEMAPYFYYFSAGGGYNQTTTPNIRFVFPNYELKDYSLSLIANGAKVVDGKAYPVVDAIFGADVAQMMMTVIPGHYQNDTSVWSQVPALIEQGVFEAVTVDAYDQTVEEDKDSEVARMSIVGAEALEAGIYTAFVIPVNEDGEAQNGEIQAISFYMNEVNTNVPTFDFLQFGCLPTQFPIPAYVAYYCPTAKDHNSFVMYYETMNYIREWKQVVAKTEALDKFFEANKDVTLEKFAQVNGTDVELENINYIDEEYGYGSEFLPFEGLAPKTSYSVVDYVVDIYGNVYCQRVDVTTAADPDAKEETKAGARRVLDMSIASDLTLKSNLLE